MSHLIWTSTSFKDRNVYLACNGLKGVYELRGVRVRGGDISVTVLLNDKAISEAFIGYADAADFAQANDDGVFDEDHYDNGGRFACEVL